MADGVRNGASRETRDLDSTEASTDADFSKGVQEAYEKFLNPWKPLLTPDNTDLNFKNPFEKQNPSDKAHMSETALQSAAGEIVHFVSKRDDFGTEYQRKQIENLLGSAINSGDLEKLCKRVNEELEKKGSDFRMEFEQKDTVKRYGHWGVSGSNPLTMEIKHPVWISDYDKITPTASVFLKDSNGHIEDGITCSGSSYQKNHPKPEGASSLPGYVPVPEDDPVHGRYRDIRGQDDWIQPKRPYLEFNSWNAKD